MTENSAYSHYLEGKSEFREHHRQTLKGFASVVEKINPRLNVALGLLKMNGQSISKQLSYRIKIRNIYRNTKISNIQQDKIYDWHTIKSYICKEAIKSYP
jgi:hypothetical protein